MSESLGNRLREAREAKDMTIEQLASITKLNPAFIEALETGRRDRLPGQVYLKPFAKACAEALGLDVKELYELINGEPYDEGKKEHTETGYIQAKKGFDYRIYVVLAIAVIAIGLIYIATSFQKSREPGSEVSFVIPAESHQVKKEIKWERPWERPAAGEIKRSIQKLTLLATDSVLVCVVADGDTVFDGYMVAGDERTFVASRGFLLSLNRRDCITGRLNGEQLTEIESGEGGLNNYRLGSEKDRR